MNKQERKALREKDAERKMLGRMWSRVKGRKIVILWITGNELGYTVGHRTPIEEYINYGGEENEIFKTIPKEQWALLRMGISAHETCHQLMTDFDYTEKVARSLRPAEQQIFMTFANTLEDPAIEYFAPSYFGGLGLKALRFSIQVIYKWSPDIDKSESAFSQLINALIQFGDMGVVKGKFTFPEAEEMFKKLAPLYNEGIKCPDPRKRIDIALRCMEISKELWEQDVKDAEELQKFLNELLKQMPQMGTGEGKGDVSKDPGEESGASKRRTITLKRLEESGKEASEASEKSSSKDGSSPDMSGDGSKGSSSSETSEGDESKDGSGKETASSESKGSGSSEEGSDSSSDKTSGPDSSSDGKSESGADIDYSKPNEGAKDGSKEEDASEEDLEIEDIEITDEDLEAISKSVEEEAKKVEKESSEEESSFSDSLVDLDLSGEPGRYKGEPCINSHVTGDVETLKATYSYFVSSYSWDIRQLKKGLEKVFESKKEEVVRKTSGKYNIIRGAVGTTAKVFDKRKAPGKTKDAAVFILIDESGSMGGPRINDARKTAIITAEALKALKIPFYVMGFTADDNLKCGAEHHHYVNWDDKRRDMETLAGIRAYCNNYDGYSIWYASELLKKRPETQKILMIISDGQPAARSYRTHSDWGLGDTVKSISEAKKKGIDVLGVFIGSRGEQECVKAMYGKDFIAVHESRLLAHEFSKKLMTLVS